MISRLDPFSRRSEDRLAFNGFAGSSIGNVASVCNRSQSRPFAKVSLPSPLRKVDRNFIPRCMPGNFDHYGVHYTALQRESRTRMRSSLVFIVLKLERASLKPCNNFNTILCYAVASIVGTKPHFMELQTDRTCLSSHRGFYFNQSCCTVVKTVIR